MQLYVFVSILNMFVFKQSAAICCLWNFWRRSLDLASWRRETFFFFFKGKGKTLGVDHVGVLGGGKEKKKYLALVRNGGLNHLLKIFNDISVFLV